MLIPIGLSNHHVHLTKEDTQILFGKDYELTKRNDLKQPGEFACNETVTLQLEDKVIDNVRIIGPNRSYTQIELLEKDAKYLEIEVPLRDSSDIQNTPGITIIGPKGKIKKEKGCIIANRHIHINNKDHLPLEDGDIVTVKINNLLLENVHVKKSDRFVLELHLNKDEALNLNISSEDKAVIYEKE